MRKKRTFVVLLGSLVVSSSLASAGGFGWNPFSTQSESAPTATQSSSFFKSPFDFFRDEEKRSTPSMTAQNQPVTEETRRLILAESRKYRLEDRQKFIASFSGLNETEARQRLRKYQQANAEPNKTAAPGTTSLSRERSTTTTTSLRQSPSSVGGASTQLTSGLGQTNPWRGNDNRTGSSSVTARPASAGHSSTVTPYVPSIANANQAKPSFSRNESISRDNSTNSPGTVSLSGYRGVPIRSASFSKQMEMDSSPARSQAAPFPPTLTSEGMSRTLDRSNQTSLPKVRPATGTQDTSHYAAHYQPGAAETSVPLQAVNVSQSRPVSRKAAAPSAGALEGPELSMLIARAEALAASSTPGQSERELREHITRHVELRLLYLLSGQRDRALTSIPVNDADEQIFWTRVFWGLSNYLDTQNFPDQADRTTSSLDQLRSAIVALQGNARLSIRHATFCSEIEGFGNYGRFERDEFTPGQEVLIYSELDNFRSERTSRGDYRTILKSSVRVSPAGEENRVIDEVQYNATEDLCRSPRQDFMQGFKYRLPQTLVPGSYVMRLIIEDQLSGKSAEYSLNFLVR